MRWIAPPGWPVPPAGWQPPSGWQPDPSWPPAPYGWRFWWGWSARRRKGFRGWAASMIPPAPWPARQRVRDVARYSPRRCWAEVFGVFALFFAVGVGAAVLSEAGQNVNPDSLTIGEDVLAGLSSLADAGLAIVVVGALTRLRGLRFADIGVAPSWGRRRAYRWQGFGVGLLFLAAVLVSGALLGLVSPNAKYPFLSRSAWHLLFEIPNSISAGVVEELVVVALLVTALEQAGTRVWMIYVVGVTLRLSYHIYYGPGVVMFLLWATATIWIFRRTRRITPLIVTHALYDTFGAFFHEIPNPPAAIGSLIGLAIIGLVLVAIVRAIQIALRGGRSLQPLDGWIS